MAWTYPEEHIWVSGEPDSAALRNLYIRDPLLDLDRRTTPQANGVDLSETTPSATYTDLATVGPSTSINVGLIGISVASWSALMGSNAAGNGAWMSVEVRQSAGVITAAGDGYALNYTPGSAGVGAAFGTQWFFGSPSGLTTFTNKYRLQTAVAAETAFFHHRLLTLQPLGS